MAIYRSIFVAAIAACILGTALTPSRAADRPATERVFEVLDLSRPGLSEVRSLHEQGNDQAAQKALVEYIRSQDWAARAPEWWEVPEEKDPDYSDPIADDLLDNIFQLGPFEVVFGPEVSDITWYEPPMDQIDDVHLFYGGTSMNRHNVWMPQLAKAWWHTGESKYAEKLVAILVDFLESCPIVDAYQVQDNQNYVTAVDEDGDGEPDRPGSAVGMVWKPFVTGRRVQNWKNLFIYCKNCEEFTPELWCRILVSIHEQTDSLVRKLPNIQNRSNHATRMGLALIDIAEFWPFMAHAQHWREVAITKLGKAYNWFDDGGFIYPDGAQTEIKVSTGPVKMVADVIKTANEYDIQLPDHLKDLHEAMAEYAFGLMWPSTFASGDAADLGRTLHELYGREDLLYIATGGEEGQKPDFVSWPSQSGEPTWAGTYFMREDWTPDATVFRTRYGPMRYSSPTRGSGSMGEISVFADGMFLIPFIRPSVYRGEFVAYGNAGFKGDGRSRNTIAVDGLGQNKYGRNTYADGPQDNPWITGPVFDYVRGSYTFDPDQHDAATIIHTRSILFARPHYALVIDRITPSDEEVHEYRMKYQLSQRLEPQTEGRRVNASCEDAGLLVEPTSEDISLQIIEGQKEPYYEGFDPNAGFAPAPALIYTWDDTGSTGTETLLYPYTPGEDSPDVQISAEHFEDGSASVTVTGFAPHTTDHIFVCGTGGTCSAGDCELQGRVGYVRTVDGEAVSAGLVEGTSLSCGEQIFSVEDLTSGWAIKEDGRWQVTTVDPRPGT